MTAFLPKYPRSALGVTFRQVLAQACRFHGNQRLRYCFSTLVVILGISLGAAGGAQAADLVFGLGQDNVDTDGHSEATAVQLEYHSDALRDFSWGSISAMGVLELDDDSDTYAGAGLSAIWNMSSRWFLEGSLAAGYYDAGSDSLDLGGDLQFRSLVGIGYRLSETSRISIAIDHLSNAGLEDTNPGRNAVFLRYGRFF